METQTTNQVVVGIFSSTSTWKLIRAVVIDLVCTIGLVIAGLVFAAAFYVPYAGRAFEWLLLP